MHALLALLAALAAPCLCAGFMASPPFVVLHGPTRECVVSTLGRPSAVATEPGLYPGDLVLPSFHLLSDVRLRGYAAPSVLWQCGGSATLSLLRGASGVDGAVDLQLRVDPVGPWTSGCEVMYPLPAAVLGDDGAVHSIAWQLVAPGSMFLWLDGALVASAKGCPALNTGDPEQPCELFGENVPRSSPSYEGELTDADNATGAYIEDPAGAYSTEPGAEDATWNYIEEDPAGEGNATGAENSTRRYIEEDPAGEGNATGAENATGEYIEEGPAGAENVTAPAPKSEFLLGLEALDRLQRSRLPPAAGGASLRVWAYRWLQGDAECGETGFGPALELPGSGGDGRWFDRLVCGLGSLPSPARVASRRGPESWGDPVLHGGLEDAAFYARAAHFPCHGAVLWRSARAEVAFAVLEGHAVLRAAAGPGLECGVDFPVSLLRMQYPHDVAWAIEAAGAVLLWVDGRLAGENRSCGALHGWSGAAGDASGPQDAGRAAWPWRFLPAWPWRLLPAELWAWGGVRVAENATCVPAFTLSVPRNPLPRSCDPTAPLRGNESANLSSYAPGEVFEVDGLQVAAQNAWMANDVYFPHADALLWELGGDSDVGSSLALLHDGNEAYLRLHVGNATGIHPLAAPSDSPSRCLIDYRIPRHRLYGRHTLVWQYTIRPEADAQGPASLYMDGKLVGTDPRCVAVAHAAPRPSSGGYGRVGGGRMTEITTSRPWPTELLQGACWDDHTGTNLACFHLPADTMRRRRRRALL